MRDAGPFSSNCWARSGQRRGRIAELMSPQSGAVRCTPASIRQPLLQSRCCRDSLKANKQIQWQQIQWLTRFGTMRRAPRRI